MLLAQGYMYVNNNQLDLAVQYLTQLLEKYPTVKGGYIARGTAYAMTGQFNLAVSDFDNALLLDDKRVIGVRTDNEELKAKVTAEVMAELEKAGATIIKSYYDGFEELSKALNKFDNYTNKYNEEVERIRQRYSAEVALQKIHELDMDLAGE
jgi:tetratricopeptide (TPR) repeat protein